MFMSLLLCGFIAATITTYSEGLANMVVRQSAVEQTLSLFPDVRMKLEDLAKRMTASEARGDVARADREKQSQQLQRIIDQNIQILTALATQGEKINGVDNRLVRIENKGN